MALAYVAVKSACPTTGGNAPLSIFYFHMEVWRLPFSLNEM
ncbi:MAG TPA: hypothetical protein VF324_07825 [Methanobacterium sp.]